MCLIAFAIRTSARWPLVVAANRDEYLSRPSAPLARWRTPGGADIVSGRDLRAGGAWFGATPHGRVAFLTNVRELNAPDAPRSRGELVTRWLESAADADSFVATLRADQADFAGFNLVIGDYQSNAWHWLTNRSTHDGQLHVQALPAGLYGLSNAALDTPWPKTLALKKALADALQLSGEPAPRAALEGLLWDALANSERVPAELLPRTGLPLAREAALSSAFVDFADGAYGTVSSTLLTVEAQTPVQGQTGMGKVMFQERQHRRGAGSASLLARSAVLNSETLTWPTTAAAI
jgi:uncharacterized protein with NRDE domain